MAAASSPSTLAAAGRTAISEAAVAKVAAVAARSVPGVFALGSGQGRALGALRDAVQGSDLAQGVRVEAGLTQAAVDLELVAVYGEKLPALAARVRSAVYEAVRSLTGLEVVEVNIDINDVHVPGIHDRPVAKEGRI